MKYIILIIGLLSLDTLADEPSSFAASRSARGTEYIIRGGMSAKQGGSVKMFGLRREARSFGPVYHSLELGGWVHNLDDGGKDAAFIKTGLGVKPGQIEGIYGLAFINLAGISTKDSYLGGHFQFSEDFGFGLRDRKSSIAVVYSHFSSAGIYRPNKGRDFITIQLGIDL